MDGELLRDGDVYVLRFERELPYPIERVWRAITDPADLAAWFPNTVEVELRVGGKAVFINDPDFDVDPELLATSGEVIELEPQHRFAFTWGKDLLRFELAPTDGGCRLVFTHRLPHRACVNRTAAGWSVSLDALDASVAGVAPAGPGWRVYYHHYVGIFGEDAVVSHEGESTVLRFERLMPASATVVQSAIDARWPATSGLKWQLIPIGDTSLVLLTRTLDGRVDMAGETAEWDRTLKELIRSLG